MNFCKRPARVGTVARRGMILWTSIFLLGLPAAVASAYAGEPTVAEALRMINPPGLGAYAVHPKQIDLPSLKVGDQIFISSSMFWDLKRFKRAPSRLMKVRLVRVIDRVQSSKKAIWKGNRWLAYVQDESGQTHAIWYPMLASGFTVEDPSAHDLYEPGEYLQVGDDRSSENVYRKFHDPTDDLTITGEQNATWIGRYIEIADPEHLRIRVRFDKFTHPKDILVPVKKAHRFATGSVGRFNQRLRGLLAVSLEFETDEVVRFRNESGLIQIGAYKRASKYGHVVRSAGEGLVEVPRQRVFRYDKGEPRTTVYNAHWIGITFERPTGLVRDFLDGAAKLTSLADYIRSTDEQKVLALVKYLNVFIPWTKAAWCFERSRFKTFEDVFRTGAAVCRHHAPLLAAMLNEAGFRARVVQYIEEGKSGHAWVEVEIVSPAGNVVTMVVDPNYDNHVKPHYVVSQDAHRDPTSMAAEFYTQPGCGHLLGVVP